jgi:hypothetical protein
LTELDAFQKRPNQEIRQELQINSIHEKINAKITGLNGTRNVTKTLLNYRQRGRRDASIPWLR